MTERATCVLDVPAWPTLTVYADELLTLRTDMVLYGDLFVSLNADGVHQRIDPEAVTTVW